MNEIFRLSTNFTDEIIALALALTALLGCLIVVYWIYYRRKFHQLTHQIPASVIKNYLDSIIQNSSALKSSLFRGGGMELPEGVPSIFPVSGLGSGSINSGPNDEMLAQKNAEISSLHARVKEKDRTIADFESRLSDAMAATGKGGTSEEVPLLKKEVARLQKELAAASAASGGGSALKSELVKVTKERDELKERLMEYEIIEEDLANLKRLQQENEQLKATIAQLKGGKVEPATVAAPVAAAAAAAIAEPEPEPEPEPELAAVSEPEPAALDDDLPAPAVDEKLAPPAEPLAEAPPAGENEQESAEELLSEFEKMLG